MTDAYIDSAKLTPVGQLNGILVPVSIDLVTQLCSDTYAQVQELGWLQP